MRILVLIHEYPPVGGGRACGARPCEGLVKQGHEILILTAHCEDLPTEEQHDGIKIQRLKSWRRLPYKADIRAMAGYVEKHLGRVEDYSGMASPGDPHSFCSAGGCARLAAQPADWRAVCSDCSPGGCASGTPERPEMV